MFTELNWKTWGLIFIIALGGTFEFLKQLPGSKAWEKENLRAENIRPYAAGKTRIGMRAQPPAMLPAPAMIKPPTTVAKAAAPAPATLTKEQLEALLKKQNTPGQATNGEAAAKKKINEDEWEIVVDPKTGKRIKRKKKKEAKKEEKKEEEKKVVKAEEKKVEDDADTSDQAIDDAISGSLRTGKLTPAPPNKADDPFQSAEEWAKRLLAKPSLSETMRFIDHFKKNLVTSEVFYKVVEQMLEDGRPEMKKLGILACANTTTYPKSFQLLAGAATSSKNDQAVKAKAEEALNAYTEMGRLAILDRVLKGGANANAMFFAASLLEKSAQKNLGAQTASTGSNATVQSRNVQVFKKFDFIATLGNLSRTATDPKVKSQAGQTLATLESLLGGVQNVAQQPPTQ